MDHITGLIKDLLELFPGQVAVHEDTVPATVRVETSTLVALGLRLRDTHGFNYLANLTAVDYRDRFEVVYHVYSVPAHRGVAIKTTVAREDPIVPSVVPVWPAADWQEREVYDMFGIVFQGHPGLRRILLPQDFQGYPLRKDFVSGR